MNACIDCMTDLDEPGTCMTTVHGSPADPVVIQVDYVNALPQAVYEALVDCTAFVNYRRLEIGSPGILMLSYFKRT